MKIKVKCESRDCDWGGQAFIGRGFPLSSYQCPRCGQNIKKARGKYDYYSEEARLKKF